MKKLLAVLVILAVSSAPLVSQGGNPWEQEILIGEGGTQDCKDLAGGCGE